jgi:hypothetical protein
LPIVAGRFADRRERCNEFFLEFLEYLIKRGFLNMERIRIHGGKSFDLGRQGQFTAFEVEVLSPYSARFYGESENLHVTFTENIEGKPLERLLDSNWDHLDLEKKQKNAPEVI